MGKLIFKKLNYFYTKDNIYNYLIQFGNISINLLLFSTLLETLGTLKFGIWQTMLSVISYVSLLNFGLGNGLRNSVAKYYVDNDFNAIGNITGQVIMQVGKFSALFFIIFIPFYFCFFSPSLLFNDISIYSYEVKYSILISIFFFVVNLLTSLSSSLAFGMSKSYLPGFANLIYIVLVYFILLIFKSVYPENLFFIAFVFGFTQVIVNVLLFVYLVLNNSIKLSFSKGKNLKQVRDVSVWFFIAQVLSIVFLTSDNLIVSKIFGPEQTAAYSIVAKVYFTLITLFSVLLIKFWNEVTILFKQRKIDLIKRNVKMLLLGSFFVLIIGLIISFYHDFILKIWFGGNSGLIGFETSSFVLFSLFAFLHCVNAIFINLQNGLGKLRIQVISTSIMIFVLIGGAFFLKGNGNYNLLIVIKSIAVFFGLLINLIALKYLNDETNCS